MRDFSFEVDILDYKQRFVERTRIFEVAAEDSSRARELLERGFDMDYVDGVRETGSVPSSGTLESVFETTPGAKPARSPGA